MKLTRKQFFVSLVAAPLAAVAADKTQKSDSRTTENRPLIFANGAVIGVYGMTVRSTETIYGTWYVSGNRGIP